jgi:hypothetical protein
MQSLLIWGEQRAFLRWHLMRSTAIVQFSTCIQEGPRAYALQFRRHFGHHFRHVRVEDVAPQRQERSEAAGIRDGACQAAAGHLQVGM